MESTKIEKNIINIEAEIDNTSEVQMETDDTININVEVIENTDEIAATVEDTKETEVEMDSAAHEVSSTKHNELQNRNLPDQHTIEAITGLTERLNELAAKGSDLTYVHKQNVSAAVWEITHNLNKYPSVTVVDSAGTTVIGECDYIDTNNVKLTFKGAFSGKAFLN